MNNVILNKNDTIEEKMPKKLWNLNFFLLWQGQLVSLLGDNIYNIAIKFWILERTGSTGIMALISATANLPRIFVSPFAGTYVDRHNRKRIIVVSDIICGAFVTFVGIATIMGIVKVWMVVVAGIIIGTCTCFFNPAVDSTMPEIVPKDKLIRANSAFSSMNTATGIISNALGGFIFKIIGAPFIFLFNGLSYIFSGISEMFITIPVKESNNLKLSFFQDMKVGINYIIRNKGLKNLYITIAVLNFFASMGTVLLIPLFNLNKSFGPGLYGIAMAFSTGGMLLGFLLLPVIEAKKLKKFPIFILSGMIQTFSMVLVPMVSKFYIVAILFFINGVGIAIINSIIQVSLQKSVPQEYRGKVFGFRRMLSASLIPIATALGGVLGEFISVKLVISFSFGVVFVLFLVLSFISSVNETIEGKLEQD